MTTTNEGFDMTAAPSTFAEIRPFLFRAGPHPEPSLRVLSLRGREAISTPYRFDIWIAASAIGGASFAGDVLGQEAKLTIDVPGGDARVIHGIVAAVQAEGVHEHDHAAYRVRLVPRLWTLKKRRTSRIFQDKSVPEIAAAVLEEGCVPFRQKLLGDHPRRAYCVQHQESDFAFVQRILAEEGIFYFFEQEPDKAVMVLADSAKTHPTIPGDRELVYRADGADGLLPKEHHVTRFSFCRAIEPGAVLQREYDFRRPAHEIRTDARAGETDKVEEQSHVYEYQGEDESNVTSGVASVRLEQHRRRATIASGEGACRRLSPGYAFTLIDHDVEALNQRYVAAEVEHVGQSPEVAKSRTATYAITFTAVPSGVVLRPRHPKRKLRQVTETAIVVGPDGQDIYTDEHGRVKVQFHWDLAGKRDEHSSCWVRVAQAWAGDGWGAQFIPRIGMEVVVTFLGGDVDRPLIVGCVYNGTHPTPFALPGHKTRSGIRSRSTRGGKGYNEIAFEDAQGKERLELHAERDMSTSVGHDQESFVAHDRRAEVSHDDHEIIRGDKAVVVYGAWSERAGSRAIRCEGDLSASAAGELAQHAGRLSAKVAKDYTLHVLGNADIVVGKAGKEAHHHSVYVHGNATTGASSAVTIRAGASITLACGTSAIEVGPDRVTIRAKHIDVTAEENVRAASARGPALQLGEKAELAAKKVRLMAEGSSLVLDQEAKLDGAKVKLNCDDEKALDEKKDKPAVETRPLKIKLSDARYGVLANKTYHVLVDGATYRGKTDAEGLVDKRVPKGAKAISIVAWLGEYPEGETKTWTVPSTPLLPPNTARGALARLANLGFFAGEPADELGKEGREAILAFQEDAGLPLSGKLDQQTVAALARSHGA